MADPVTPTPPIDPWVARINALADAIRGMSTPVLALIAALSSIYGGIHSQFASTQSNANAAEIKAVGAKIDESSAKLMTAKPFVNAWAPPAPTVQTGPVGLPPERR